MMRHFCARCNKLFDEKDMILNVYHDGEDWYCKLCNSVIVDGSQDFQKKLEEYEKKVKWLDKRKYNIGEKIAINRIYEAIEKQTSLLEEIKKLLESKLWGRGICTVY